MIERHARLPGISKAAATAIAEMLGRFADEVKEKDYLPAVGWAYDSPEPDCVPVPCVGVHRRANVAAHCIVEQHGLSVVFDLPDEVLEKHRDCVLDFVDGRFFFREKGLFRLFDRDAD
jgi:hypothetical protein